MKHAAILANDDVSLHRDLGANRGNALTRSLRKVASVHAVRDCGDDRRELGLCLGRGHSEGSRLEPLVWRDIRPVLFDARERERVRLDDGRGRLPHRGQLLRSTR